MPFDHNRLIASAFLAGLIGFPGMALAQTAEPEKAPAAEQQPAQPSEELPPSQTEPQAEAAKPTEKQLESFAAATVRIVQIQEAAQKEMKEAVEKAGLTIEEYNQIAQVAQTDPKIEQALQELIKSRLGG